MLTELVEIVLFLTLNLYLRETELFEAEIILTNSSISNNSV